MARKCRIPRKLRSSIAIIGEGITEQEYFISLKNYMRYSFKVKPQLPQNSSYKQIFKKAKELIKNDGTDLVYCLIDMDNILSKNQQEQLQQASSRLVKSVGQEPSFSKLGKVITFLEEVLKVLSNIKLIL